MGLLRDFRQALSAAYAPAIASPWAPSPSHLESWVWQDILGADADTLPLTRAEAMTVPAVARARSLICGTIAQLPLRAYRDGVDVTADHYWLTRTDTELSMYHTMLWTADDLLFHGWALWLVARSADGRVQAIDRVRPERWTIDTEGRIQLDGIVPDRAHVCLIPGINEGLLKYGTTAVRHAKKLFRAANVAAETPAPNLELHQTGGAPMTNEQIDALIGRWASARRGLNGGVAYTNATIETKEHRAPSENLLIEGRNAAAVEVARACNLPASMLDATTPKASLSYETAEGKSGELIDYGLAPYLTAISSRLSLDDMVPRGTAIRFDLEDQIGPARQVGTQAPAGAAPAHPPPAPAGPPPPARLEVVQ